MKVNGRDEKVGSHVETELLLGSSSNKAVYFLQGRPQSFSFSDDRTQIYVVQRKFKNGEKMRLELSGNSSEIVFYVH